MDGDIAHPIAPVAHLLPPHRLADDSATRRIHVEMDPDHFPQRNLPRFRSCSTTFHDGRFRAGEGALHIGHEADDPDAGTSLPAPTDAGTPAPTPSVRKLDPGDTAERE